MIPLYVWRDGERGKLGGLALLRRTAMGFISKPRFSVVLLLNWNSHAVLYYVLQVGEVAAFSKPPTLMLQMLAYSGT